MALRKLGSGTEEGMQLLAGFAGNDDGGGRSGGGGAFGVTALAVEKLAKVAKNIITTGSVTGGSDDAGGVRRTPEERVEN